MPKVHPEQTRKQSCVFILLRGTRKNKQCGNPIKKGTTAMLCSRHFKRLQPTVETEKVEIPQALLPKKTTNQTSLEIASFHKSPETTIGAQLQPVPITHTIKPYYLRTLKEKEKCQVLSIVDNIRSNTPAGQTLKMAFSKKNPDEEIVDAIAEGGSNRDHYDFKIEVLNRVTGETTIKNVEHKGNRKDKLDFYRSCVQFFNGPANQFEIGEKYAHGYYEMFVKSGVISTKYGICAEILSYNEWKKGAFSSTPPNNAYTKELYEKTVHKTSKTPNGTKTEKREYTKIFNDLLTVEDKDTIMRQAIERANSVMLEKHYWLNIKGDINGKFDAEWNTGLIQFGKPVSFEILKSVDCKYRIICEDKNHLDVVIRWGRYDGICNLRIDLK